MGNKNKNEILLYGCVYKLFNSGGVYIGSCENFRKREIDHKRKNTCTSKILYNNGKVEHDILQEYTNIKSIDLKKEEQIYMDLIGMENLVNIQRAYTSPEKTKEIKRIYKQNNKVKIAKQRARHYQKNKDKIAEQKKIHYQKNKDIINEKIKCGICGFMSNKKQLRRHQKTKFCKSIQKEKEYNQFKQLKKAFIKWKN